MAIVFARLETFKSTADYNVRDKLDYIARQGRFAAKGDLVRGPVQILPEGAPRRFSNAKTMWQEADAAERSGAIAALEIVLALPSRNEVSLSDWDEICRAFGSALVASYGVAVTFAIHSGQLEPAGGERAEDGQIHEATHRAPGPSAENGHAHLLVTTRVVTPSGFAPYRHTALLPTIAGGKTCHVLDAVDIGGLYRNTLETFFAQRGEARRPRLTAPHAAYHVGPVSAVGAALADLEEIARRPDGAALLRKVKRIAYNSEIEARNVAAMQNPDLLLQHLSDRAFRESELVELIRRYTLSAVEVFRLRDQVLAQCRQLLDPVTGAGSGQLLTPELIATERQILEHAAEMCAGNVADTAAGGEAGADFPDIASFTGNLIAGPYLTIAELPGGQGDQTLPELIVQLWRHDAVPVLVTHRSKGRPTPDGVAIRPLHWEKHFKLHAGETALVDEADALTPGSLLRLLETAQSAGARVILLRRPVRSGWNRSPQLDALAARHGQIRFGPTITAEISQAIARKDYSTLIQCLAEKDRLVQFDSDENLLEFVGQYTQRRGKGQVKPFVLCADPELTARLMLQTSSQGQVLVGPCLPPDHDGPILLLLGTSQTSVPLLPQLRGRKFLLLTSLEASPGLSDIVSRLALMEGYASSMTCPSRSMLPNALRSLGDAEPIAFALEDVPQPMPRSARGRTGQGTQPGVELFRNYVAEIDRGLDHIESASEQARPEPPDATGYLVRPYPTAGPGKPN